MNRPCDASSTCTYILGPCVDGTKAGTRCGAPATTNIGPRDPRCAKHGPHSFAQPAPGTVTDIHGRPCPYDPQYPLYAFWSFVSDAQAGEMTFDEFAGEYGYDVDSITSRRTWSQCKTSRAKLADLFHDDRSPESIIELLAFEGIE